MATEHLELQRETDVLERFERFEIEPGAFHHRDHVEVAYAMLRKYPFLEATARYAGTIRTMAANAGAADKFHVTITVAFLSLIAERMESSEHRDFETFGRANPDLFSKEILARFYLAERLGSEVARRIFVLPDPSPR